MIHLRAIALKQNVKKPDSFPFNLPLVKAFEEINFQKPVTFFVGEKVRVNQQYPTTQTYAFHFLTNELWQRTCHSDLAI
jgi:menaquinone-dependent protoporphyrinogen IX oxidase